VNDNIVVEESEHKLTLRQLQREDYADITSIMSSVYGKKWPLSGKKFFTQLDVFPEGQICIEDHGAVIAAAFSVIVDYDDFGDHHTYDEITGAAFLTTHDPKGDVLYGVDVLFHLTTTVCDLAADSMKLAKSYARALTLKVLLPAAEYPTIRIMLSN